MDDDCGIATAFADPHNGLGNIDRYQTKVERAYLRAVETLRKTQNDRLRRERQNGFVPQTPATQTAPRTNGVIQRYPAAQTEPRTIVSGGLRNELTQSTRRNDTR
jgi:hypothetical protein